LSVQGFPFTTFPTYGAVVAWLNSDVGNHPNAEIIVIGQTYQGNDIVGIHIGADNSKDLVYIHCGIHAREWITVTTCAWIIDNLLNQDPDRATLLSRYQYIVVPVFNVDGYQYSHTNDRLWRKNREPGAGCVGTDINRNYGYGWGGDGSSGQPCSETYRGTAAWSTYEAFAERAFLQPYIDSGRLAIYFDIHSYGGYYMSAWGYTTTLPPDFNRMNAIAQRATDAMWAENGRTYTYGASSRVLYISSGGTVDFTYGSGGVVISYTIEAFGSSFTPPTSWILPIAYEIWAGVKDTCLNDGKA